MAKPTLGTLNTTQTFQNWFDKTNEIVTILKTDAITAGGDSTNGNATLTGTFTAGSLTATTLLSSDQIAARSTALINFQDPVQITGSAATTATFLYSGTGGQARFTDGAIAWDVGHDETGAHSFIIDTGTGDPKFKLTAAGTLTVSDVVVTGSLSANTLSIGGGGSGLNSDDITEGTTNLYHSPARVVSSLSGGDGINLSAGGVISFDGQGELDTYTGNKFIGTGGYTDGNNYAYIEGRKSGSTEYLRIAAVRSSTDTALVDFAANMNVYSAIYTYGDSYSYVSTSGNKTYHHDVSLNTTTFFSGGSTIKAQIDGDTGSAIFAGDLTSNGSFSDRRLKENIVPLGQGLKEVNQIKTYKFNYKNRPEDTLPGVIAQEIEEILPEVVYNIEMEDDTYKAVRYQQIVPVLIEAIKELTEKVNVLENRLNNDV